MGDAQENKPCWAFQTGSCTYGNACKFAHVRDANFRPRACRYFARGACHKGAECTFSHDAADTADFKGEREHTTRESASALKLQGVCGHFLKGRCAYGDRCRYKHVKDGRLENPIEEADEGAEGGKEQGIGGDIKMGHGGDDGDKGDTRPAGGAG